MDGITCDLCGKSLLVDENVRYVGDVVIYAAYDPMELTSNDLELDTTEEIRKTLEAIEKRDTKDLEEEIIATRHLDLCPSCRKHLLNDVLSPKYGTDPGKE